MEKSSESDWASLLRRAAACQAPNGGGPRDDGFSLNALRHLQNQTTPETSGGAASAASVASREALLKMAATIDDQGSALVEERRARYSSSAAQNRDQGIQANREQFIPPGAPKPASAEASLAYSDAYAAAVLEMLLKAESAEEV